MKTRAKTKEARKSNPAEAQSLEFERRVAEYLQADKTFFVRHPDLLTQLALPHPSGAAISLVERQVTLLREQNRALKQQLHDLTENAKANSSLSEKTQTLILAILDATSPQAVLEALCSALRTDFNADTLALWLFFDPQSPPPPFPHRSEVALIPQDSPKLDAFTHILKSARPICGRLTAKQNLHLFGETAKKAASCALIPLREPQCRGLLAIGNRRPDHFRADLGTLFLDYLGAAVGRALQHHWTGTGNEKSPAPMD